MKVNFENSAIYFPYVDEHLWNAMVNIFTTNVFDMEEGIKIYRFYSKA